MTGVIVEFFPEGLVSAIVIKYNEYSLSWDNITSEVDFTHTLWDSQELSKNSNSTFYHYLNEKRAGKYIYTPYEEGSQIDNLVWDSRNKTFVIDSEIESEMPLNIKVFAHSVVMKDVTTVGINNLNITTGFTKEEIARTEEPEIPHKDHPVVINNLGSEEAPIKSLAVSATHFILLGDSWVYKLNVETFDRENKALITATGICNIDTSVMQTFAGYDVVLKTNGEEQCISFGGKFLVEHSLRIFSDEMHQIGLIASKGDAEINVHKGFFEGEVVTDDNLTFKGEDNLFFNSTSVLRSNTNITIVWYERITFDGTVGANNTISLTVDSVKQGAEGSISARTFSFQGKEIEFCGSINVEEMNLQAQRMEFCPTAKGYIGKVIVSNGNFTQNGDVRIGVFESRNATVKGNVFTQNFTGNFIGNTVLEKDDHIFASNKMRLNATGSIINKANLRTNTSEVIAVSFENERGGKLEADGMGSFILEQDMVLHPGSKIQVGAIAIATRDNNGIQFIAKVVS